MRFLVSYVSGNSWYSTVVEIEQEHGPITAGTIATIIEAARRQSPRKITAIENIYPLVPPEQLQSVNGRIHYFVSYHYLRGEKFGSRNGTLPLYNPIYCNQTLRDAEEVLCRKEEYDGVKLISCIPFLP